MNTFKTVTYLALALSLGTSISASAKSFPQDFLDMNRQLEKQQVSSQQLVRDTSVAMNANSVTQYIEKRLSYKNTAKSVELKEHKTTMMKDKKATSFHLFSQYL